MDGISCVKIHITWHLPFLGMQLSGIEYTHIVVLPSPSSISRTVFILQNWNSIPETHTVEQWLPCLPSPSQFWQPQFHFLSPWSRVLWVPHVGGIIQNLSFCDWFISFSIMSSRFINVVTCVRIYPLLKGDYYSSVCISRVLFIHLSVEGHMDCCPLLAVINRAAYESECTSFSWRTCFQFFRV